MHALCKDAIENAQLGAPAASVLIVAILAIAVWGIIIYLDPPRFMNRKTIESRAVSTIDE